jgi:hypothetical protein
VAALVAPAAVAASGASRAPRLRTIPPTAAAAKNRKTVPGVVLVTYQPGTSKADRTSARRFVHATRGEALSPLSGAAEQVTLPSVVSVDTAITALERRPEVRSAEPDYVLRTDASSNDPLLTEDDGHGPMWGLLSGSSSPANTYGSGAIGAWAQGVTGSHNIVIGVVDEGIQVDHPDLAANIWTNPWDPPNGLDDDGNGYVDDVHGWDFKHNDNSVYDGPLTDDHATHVAGTIGAVGGNGTGVVGVNWNVTLISAKFLEGTGDTADAIRAIDYLTDLKVRHGLQIVASNNSWGGGGSSQALTDAINRGGDQGILFVAAAGNDTMNDDGAGAFYPAAGKCDRHYPSGAPRGWDCIVSVAAITKTGALASYSNFGAVNVDLGAPGSDILSTYPPSQYAWIDGTSMAAPHVTGALALLASCSFGLTPSQLRADLLASATTTPSLAGKTSTGKRLDVSKLISTYCNLLGPPTAVITGPSGIGVGSSFDETVWFSHAVTGLAAGDFDVGATSALWDVSGVSGSDAGPYTVTLSSAAPTDGTVTLTLGANSVSDGTSTGPPAATAGPVVHIDRTAPHAVVTLPATPTKAPTLTATLSFDEGIMGLAAGDLSVTGTATGCSIGDPIDGLANKSFTVQVSGCGEGTVALTLAADSISDLSSNDGPAAPAVSGVVTIDRTPAVATLAPPGALTAAATPLWTLSFDEAVRSSSISAGDFVRGGTATGCVVNSPMQTGPTTYAVGVSGCGSGSVTLELKAGSMTDLAGNVSPTNPADATAVVVDHALPTTSSPGISTRTGIAVSGSTLPISAEWTGADAGSGVARYQLQRSINGGAFTWVSTNIATPPVSMGLSSGARVQLRVRAVDIAGNVGAWRTGSTVTGLLVQNTSSSIHYAGSWTTSSSSSYSGGSVKTSSTAGSSATYTFTGRGIALVSTLSASRGTVRVYVDGIYQGRVDPSHAPTVFHGVAWQMAWSSSKTRTLKLIVDGTAGRPRFDLDAFAVLK